MLFVFLGSGIVLGSLRVILLTNAIYSTFYLGTVVCMSLFYILSNSSKFYNGSVTESRRERRVIQPRIKPSVGWTTIANLERTAH